jgi:hypothetical protein
VMSYLAVIVAVIGALIGWSPLAALLLPCVLASAFLTLGSLQLVTGHYLYMVHSQLRSGPNARTEEI